MGRVILITGSNRGIGYEIARQCGGMGFYVIISGRDEIRLNRALEELHKAKIDAGSLLIDVSSLESIESAASQFATQKRGIDVLINNAGIIIKGDKSLIQNDNSILNQTINTNSLRSPECNKGISAIYQVSRQDSYDIQRRRGLKRRSRGMVASLLCLKDITQCNNQTACF